jgi:hypothetical protein
MENIKMNIFETFGEALEYAYSLFFIFNENYTVKIKITYAPTSSTKIRYKY